VNLEKRRAMGTAAREKMNGVSWDIAFEMTYAAYRFGMNSGPIVAGRVSEQSARSTRKPEIAAS
jgi:hypothetical protein